MPSSTWTARGGSARALPHDFPPWSTVWTYFRTWRNDGTWERIHTALREQVRVKQGREPTGSRSDYRQPIRENEPKRGRRGYDGGKKVKGRKRHILVDTNGLIMHQFVHEASLQDHDGGKDLLSPL